MILMESHRVKLQEFTALLFAAICAAIYTLTLSYVLEIRDNLALAFGSTVLICAMAAVLSVRLVHMRHICHVVGPLRQKLRALEAHSMVSMVDRRGRLVCINDQFTALTGHTRKAVIGQPVCKLYPEGAQSIALAIRDRMNSGEKWQGETPLMHASGRTIYTQTTTIPMFDCNGDLDGSISVRTDTTKVKEMRADRRVIETLNELRDDVWIIDKQRWNFTYMNLAARGRLCLNHEQCGDHGIDDIMADPELAKILHACHGMDRRGTTSTRFEVIHNNVPLQVSIKLLSDPYGAGRFLILLSDVSDQREQDRRISDFVSTVSHELRSPLTSIKGALRLLMAMEKKNLSKQGFNLLDIAHRSSDRLILIINDILDLEKLSKGEMPMQFQDTDLSDLVIEAQRAIAMESPACDLIELQGTDTPRPFRTDPNRVIQVLTNLLSNACKFSPPGGRVLVSIEEEPDCFRIAVQDRGPGIPAKDHYKVFQRFADMENSERASKGGTGLGLSICKAIVEGMGGTIGFQVCEKTGTTFYFSLPRNLGALADSEEPVSQSTAV